MTTNNQFEQDSAEFNRKYAVQDLALEILRNGSSLMTMAEAIAKAEAIYDAKEAK